MSAIGGGVDERRTAALWAATHRRCRRYTCWIPICVATLLLMLCDHLSQASVHVKLHPLEGSISGGHTSRHSVHIEAPTVTGARRRVQADVVQTYKLIIWIVDMCGKGGGPAATSEAIRAVMLGGGGNRAGNFADYVATCSNDVAHVDRGALTIVDVRMPCSGTTSSGAPWTVSSCQGNNPFGWFDYLEQQASAKGIDLSVFTHRIMVLPKNKQQFMESSCNWAGLGTQGKVWGRGPAFGYVWLAGEASNLLAAYMHEIGHTLGLKHAATADGCSACDSSSVMASYGSATPQCFNAAQNWALGWATEVQPVSFLTMPSGVPFTYKIPGQSESMQSVLKVESVSTVTVFLSLRSNSGIYDNPYASSADRARVLIHTWDSVALKDFTVAVPTVLQASLASAGNFWADASTGLAVSVVAIDPNGESATVTLCKPLEVSRETSCFNGLDDDCDGVADEDDPDCYASIVRPSPPPPSPPPPVPPPPPMSPSPPAPSPLPSRSPGEEAVSAFRPPSPPMNRAMTSEEFNKLLDQLLSEIVKSGK